MASEEALGEVLSLLEPTRVGDALPDRLSPSARPQAWAAGAPVLMLQALLGLQPDLRQHVLTSLEPDELPSWVGDIRRSGVHAFGRLWDIHLKDGRIDIEEL